MVKTDVKSEGNCFGQNLTAIWAMEEKLSLSLLLDYLEGNFYIRDMRDREEWDRLITKLQLFIL